MKERLFLVEHDLTDCFYNALDRLLEQEAATPFDLAAGPLIRGRLIRLSQTEHILLGGILGTGIDILVGY